MPGVVTTEGKIYGEQSFSNPFAGLYFGDKNNEKQKLVRLCALTGKILRNPRFKNLARKFFDVELLNIWKIKAKMGMIVNK